LELVVKPVCFWVTPVCWNIILTFVTAGTSRKGKTFPNSPPDGCKRLTFVLLPTFHGLLFRDLICLPRVGSGVPSGENRHLGARLCVSKGLISMTLNFQLFLGTPRFAQAERQPLVSSGTWFQVNEALGFYTLGDGMFWTC
jgi:hypothetical protein